MEYGNARDARRPSQEELGNYRKDPLFKLISCFFRTAPAIAARATVIRLRRLREEAAKEK